MMRLRLGILAAIAVAAASATTASGSDRHPWCLVVQDWGDGWSCGFDSFVACTAEARAGNVGYCAANPAYQAPAPAKTPRGRRKPHR